jgi:hypothetical protein
MSWSPDCIWTTAILNVLVPALPALLCNNVPDAPRSRAATMHVRDIGFTQVPLEWTKIFDG